jgi:hypothetical protein
MSSQEIISCRIRRLNLNRKHNLQCVFNLFSRRKTHPHQNSMILSLLTENHNSESPGESVCILLRNSVRSKKSIGFIRAMVTISQYIVISSQFINSHKRLLDTVHALFLGLYWEKLRGSHNQTGERGPCCWHRCPSETILTSFEQIFPLVQLQPFFLFEYFPIWLHLLSTLSLHAISSI